MRFKIGQEVVCVHRKSGWEDEYSESHNEHPKYNEICTVTRSYQMRPPHTAYYIEVAGYPYGYREDLFEPVIDITELCEVLQSEPLAV